MMLSAITCRQCHRQRSRLFSIWLNQLCFLMSYLTSSIELLLIIKS